MQHIDDGLLNAYLDNALDAYPPEEARWVEEHLPTCDECERRLEEQRVVRAAAQGLLEDTAPSGVELASLDDLRARARAAEPEVEDVPTREARPRTAPGVFVQLSWAASLIVALGAGWVARDLRVAARPAGTFDQLTQVSAPAAEAPPERAAEAVLGGEADVQERVVLAEGLSSPDESASALGKASADPADLDESSDAPAELEVARNRVAAESRLEVTSAPVPARALADVAGAAVPSGAVVPSAAAVPLGAFRELAAAEEIGAGARSNRAPLSPTLPVDLNAAAFDDAPEANERWERPRTFEDEGLGIVDGLGLVRRYVEVLEDGRRLEFWLVPSSDAPDGGPSLSEVRDFFERDPLPDGWSQLFRVREEGVLAVRGAMSLDELGAHVDRLRPRR